MNKQDAELLLSRANHYLTLAKERGVTFKARQLRRFKEAYQLPVRDVEPLTMARLMKSYFGFGVELSADASELRLIDYQKVFAEQLVYKPTMLDLIEKIEPWPSVVIAVPIMLDRLK